MINTVFMGTPQIAVNTLKSMIGEKNINVMAVVTPPDRPQGRKMTVTSPPVKVTAEDNNIPVYQTKSIRHDNELIDTLNKLRPDFFVTFAYGQMLSQDVLDIPKYGTINVHASLLPKYRGANPIQHAIINGDKITGITTMLTSLGMDEGDICLKEKIEITDDMTDLQLRKAVSDISPDILIKTLKGLFEKKITPVKQNNDEATYARRFTREDGKIDFNDAAKNIHNKVRGMYSWPGCYFEYNGKKVKVYETEISKHGENYKKGVVNEITKDGISIGTQDGCVILKEVQPESKNRMSALAWNNSVQLKIGDEIC